MMHETSFYSKAFQFIDMKECDAFYPLTIDTLDISNYLEIWYHFLVVHMNYFFYTHQTFDNT